MLPDFWIPLYVLSLLKNIPNIYFKSFPELENIFPHLSIQIFPILLSVLKVLCFQRVKHVHGAGSKHMLNEIVFGFAGQSWRDRA